MCVMTKRRTNVVVLGQMHEHHTNLEPRAADKNAYLRRAFHLFVHSLFLLPLVSSTFAFKSLSVPMREQPPDTGSSLAEATMSHGISISRRSQK